MLSTDERRSTTPHMAVEKNWGIYTRLYADDKKEIQVRYFFPFITALTLTLHHLLTSPKKHKIFNCFLIQPITFLMP